MTYEEVKNHIRELKVLHVKVIDVQGKKILEFIGELSPENLINKIDCFQSSLQSWGRVTFIAATETQYKQNWKDCFQWPVVFNAAVVTTNNHSPQIGAMPSGFISQSEAMLMAENAKLKLEMDFNKRFSDLEAKINGKDSKEGDIERLFDKYGHFILPKLGINMAPPTPSADELVKLYHYKAMMEGNNGMAGLYSGTKNGAKVEATEEEKKQIAEIESELDKLSEKTSVDNIRDLIKGLNENPQFIPMALQHFNSNKK